MTPESLFLIAFGQALATMGLYGEGHPARERVVDASFELLLGLLATSQVAQFSFLGGETVFAHRVIPELATWDWASRLAAAQIERIEVDADVSREAYRRFLDDTWNRLNGRMPSSSEVQQLVRASIRSGSLRFERPDGSGDGESRSALAVPRLASGPISMADEIAAVEWIHGEVQRDAMMPMAEVEAVTRSLAATMHTERGLLLPMLTLKNFDQYTTTHACNVGVLAMGLAERLDLGREAVRSFGIAGLLHDIGKVRIPRDLLIKPGRYTDEEREVIKRHPVDGARILLEREQGPGLATVVAYEHHIFLDGGGYPSFRFPRACHYASRLVHVCDIYDALCTNRPYRAAWEPEEALAYLEKQAGTELDPHLVHAFAGLIRNSIVKRMPFNEAREGAIEPAA